MSSELPSTGRLAAVDYGHVRLGIAVSDARQTVASPIDNYTRCGEDRDALFLKSFVADEQIVGWIVGLPVHMSGEESQKSLESREFGKWLQHVTQLPVQFFDERFSTAIANQIMAAAGLTAKKRKKKRDMLAAQVILASFLESSRGAQTPPPLEG